MPSSEIIRFSQKRQAILECSVATRAGGPAAEWDTPRSERAERGLSQAAAATQAKAPWNRRRVSALQAEPPANVPWRRVPADPLRSGTLRVPTRCRYEGGVGGF